MKLIAIPTRDSMVDDHFGHCAYYTVVSPCSLVVNGLLVKSQNQKARTPDLFMRDHVNFLRFSSRITAFF